MPASYRVLRRPRSLKTLCYFSSGVKLRVARRVWRDYYRHSFARQHCADPSTESLADQQRRRTISEEDSKRDEQERAKNHELWAWKARNLSAVLQRSDAGTRDE